MNKRTGAWLLAAAMLWAPVSLMTAMAEAAPPANRPLKKAIVQVKLSVRGMSCSGCEHKVQAAALTVPGVRSCEASYDRNEAVVTYDPAKVKIEEVVTALKKAGFQASLQRENT